MEKLSLRINRILNAGSAFLMLLMTFITVVDVLGRFLFNHPLPGTIEVTELSLVLIAYLAFGYAEHHGEHIVIDAAYEIMPDGMKRISSLLAGMISVVTIAVMAWQMYVYAGRMSAGGYNTAVLGIPLSPVIVVAAFASLCYALAILCNLVKSAGSARRTSHS